MTGSLMSTDIDLFILQAISVKETIFLCKFEETQAKNKDLVIYLRTQV